MHFNNNNQLSAQRQFHVGPAVKEDKSYFREIFAFDLTGEKGACPLFSWQTRSRLRYH